jgi:capsular polysaccharide biosynthesis protein
VFAEEGVWAFVTLIELLQLFKKKWFFFIIFPVVFALAVGAYAFAFMSNDYSASVDLYVLAKDDKEASATVSSGEMAASQQLANDIAVLAGSNRVEMATATKLAIPSLKGYDIKVNSASTNRMITVEVTGKDPAAVATIADELANQITIAAVEVMDLKAVNTVDDAQVPTVPSGPNRPQFILVAFLAGLVVAAALIVLLDMLNTTVRTSEEAEELLELPIIGHIPDFK